MNQIQTELLPNAPLDLDHVSAADVRARWPQLLIDVHAVFADTLNQRTGPNDPDAISTDLTRALAKYFGGREWYLPKGDKLDLALRDAAIWREFTGRNIHALCGQYNLCDRQIATILAQQRALHRNKIQPSLF